MEKYDGIIVGAGIIGCSIAYHLTTKGFKKLLVVDKGGIASGVTGICPGGVRQQWGTEINCLMSKRSVSFFENINEHLQPKEKIGYKSVGYLRTFHSDRAIEGYQDIMKLQNSLDIPTRMLTPDEVEEIIPGINKDSFLTASFCGTDGFVDDANHVTQSFADAAKREGTTFIDDEVVKILKSSDNKVTGIFTKENGEIASDFVVNAAGLGSKELAETIDVHLPITFEKRRILYTKKIEERLLDPLLMSFEKGFAAKQFANGVLYMSYLGKDLDADSNLQDFQRKTLEVGREIFPVLDQVELRTHIDGIYDSTPDHQAILGDVNGIDGYYQAVGMSGHGFMMSPAIGESIACMIAGEKQPMDVSSLHFDRFETNKLLFEPSVV
ncbi:NAD(P)/FAD-dependent oxidoreductase [Evansella sp. AB-rgal1]|uniref:NAD(P)/FAD-dependent oxidoreductase n=1 Tax=Evansella sp. AB-rgal1 TaxID=3242696 RepID=UPI00359D8633